MAAYTVQPRSIGAPDERVRFNQITPLQEARKQYDSTPSELKRKKQEKKLFVNILKIAEIRCWFYAPKL